MKMGVNILCNSEERGELSWDRAWRGLLGNCAGLPPSHQIAFTDPRKTIFTARAGPPLYPSYPSLSLFFHDISLLQI